MAVGPNRAQEVRVNGPIGAHGQMRMDVNFPGQPGPGICSQNLFFKLKAIFDSSCLYFLSFNHLLAQPVGCYTVQIIIECGLHAEGAVRMANAAMVPPGPGMPGPAMVPSGSGQMHPRMQRPVSQTG